MKRIHILLAAILLAVFCSCTGTSNHEISDVHPDWTYNSVVYELNVRQYSPEGTFASAQKQLPRLKSLGVDVIWLMPIYPIGVKERKGSLGSYYAISDYKAVNPEFGEMADFENFLKEAHKEGFHVILDWVANHTSPDAKWITESPADWYERDSLGNTVVEYDWTDIAALNYDNKDVWKAMDDAMRFWLQKGIDGFRCDMACEVPIEFWRETIPALRNDYPGIYMLAEGEKPELHESAFDASYAWKLHHLLNDIAQSKAGVAELKDYINQDATDYPNKAFRLMFTSNHDENSWSGSEFERMGAAAKTMAVLTFTLPNSQPLLYTGQEVGMDRRFKFFDKDDAPDWTSNEYTDFYSKLISIKHKFSALDSGEKGGAYSQIEEAWVPEKVFAFSRGEGKDEILVFANFSDAATTIELPSDSTFYNAFTGEKYYGNGLVLDPWGFSVMSKRK